MRALEVKCEIIGAAFDQEQFDLLMQCSAKHDMTEWDEWKKNNPKRPVLLQNANLAKAYLRGADLRRADFRGANLRGADLSGAKLPDFSRRWADLSGADFREADLCGTDFRGADMSGANFGRAYLYYTNFSWTNLSGANFRGADLWSFLYKAILTSVDLSLANRKLSEFTRIGSTLAPKPALPFRRSLALSHGAKQRPVSLRQNIADAETYPKLKVAAG
jgi:hypothetical protein